MIQKGVRSKHTLNKHLAVYQHLFEFMQYKHRRTDIAFQELTADFIKDFDFYLRINKGLTHNTIWGYMMPLCKMIEIALEKDLIHKNPFREYDITMQEKDRGYLLKEEVEQLLVHTFKNKNRELVRDLFVFSCFTGLSYIDIKQLKKNQVQTFFDGNRWILSRRQKR